MSDCSVKAWRVPEQREPGTYYIQGHPNVDYSKAAALDVNGVRFERVRKCEMEESFIEPKRLDFMQEYRCSECEEYGYMQIACDGDAPSYCQNCGAKVVSADD